MKQAITMSEYKRLAVLEDVIDKGKKCFVEVGIALAEIRDSKLYRQEFNTFSEYCQVKWGWARRYAYNLIEAAETVKGLPENVRNCAQTESQARELARVEPEKRAQVIEIASTVAAAEERQMTARDIREAANEPDRPHANTAGEKLAEQSADAKFRERISLAYRALLTRFAACDLPKVRNILRELLAQEPEASRR